ncbi:DUF2281 domain-containing protein [Salmonirosea aquatica]|uniref:DUF2281 domain-containing protein n=1 Tax=Salmonirosea aquatica TaxID=2654236 RepID=A0A7C9FXV2_9BACT|nr:hypothetical protein [Cytophagaceae bacterium SJW1-29]
MYTAIKGIYENGKLTLLEPAPDVEKAEVLVTFLEETTHSFRKKKRTLGGLKSLGGSIPEDFNEPLDDLKDYV